MRRDRAISESPHRASGPQSRTRRRRPSSAHRPFRCAGPPPHPPLCVVVPLTLLPHRPRHPAPLMNCAHHRHRHRSRTWKYPSNVIGIESSPSIALCFIIRPAARPLSLIPPSLSSSPPCYRPPASFHRVSFSFDFFPFPIYPSSYMNCETRTYAPLLHLGSQIEPPLPPPPPPLLYDLMSQYKLCAPDPLYRRTCIYFHRLRRHTPLRKESDDAEYAGLHTTRASCQ